MFLIVERTSLFAAILNKSSASFIRHGSFGCRAWRNDCRMPWRCMRRGSGMGQRAVTRLIAAGTC
jgi:hypothetical protein